MFPNRMDRIRNLGKGAPGDNHDPTIAFILLFSLPICGLLAQAFYIVKGELTMESVRKAYVRLHFHDFLTILWYSIDAMTHLTMELSYLILALTSTAEKSNTLPGWVWREYSRADARWAVRDANVISIEILTMFMGILCVLQIYGTFFKTSWRHPLQMIICVAELYGGWMTFCPEWVDGSPNLNTGDPVLLWIYLVFMNGLWVVIPGLLLWDSYARLCDVCDVAKARLDLEEVRKVGAPTRAYWNVAGITIVLYMVLVPGIIFSANGVPVKQ
jgi:hypothetical protein